MAIAKQPKNIIGYTALTNYYVFQKDYDDALKTTRAGLAQQPDSLPLHLTLAGILEATGNFDARNYRIPEFAKHERRLDHRCQQSG